MFSYILFDSFFFHLKVKIWFQNRRTKWKKQIEGNSEKGKRGQKQTDTLPATHNLSLSPASNESSVSQNEYETNDKSQQNKSHSFTDDSNILEKNVFKNEIAEKSDASFKDDKETVCKNNQNITQDIETKLVASKISIQPSLHRLLDTSSL